MFLLAYDSCMHGQLPLASHGRLEIMGPLVET